MHLQNNHKFLSQVELQNWKSITKFGTENTNMQFDAWLGQILSYYEIDFF